MELMDQIHRHLYGEGKTESRIYSDSKEWGKFEINGKRRTVIFPHAKYKIKLMISLPIIVSA